jgi:hypothetical protein
VVSHNVGCCTAGFGGEKFKLNEELVMGSWKKKMDAEEI